MKHTTSSPLFLRANGEVERVIQTIENLWRKNNDKYLALLHCRTTPLPNIELSPAQLLMGRRLRNDLPVMEALLQPANNSPQHISKYLIKTKEDQKKHYDKHASKELKKLQPGDKVRLEPWTDSREWKPVTVVRHHHSPTSYVVPTVGRKYRRNRQHLRVSTAPGLNSDDQAIPPAVEEEMSSQTIPPAIDEEMSSQENAVPLSVASDQTTTSPTVNPDYLPEVSTSPQYHPGLPADNASSYVPRSSSGNETQTIWLLKLETIFDIVLFIFWN